MRGGENTNTLKILDNYRFENQDDEDFEEI